MNKLRNTMNATERAKSEVRMQKHALLHSSFLLPTFPVLANPPFNDSDLLCTPSMKGELSQNAWQNTFTL